MIAIENRKSERGKLLAAVAVLALVVCAFAAILPATETSAYGTIEMPTEGEYTELTITPGTAVDLSTDEATVYKISSGTVTIDGVNFNLPAGEKIYVASGATLEFQNSSEGIEMLLNGDVYLQNGAKLILSSQALRVGSTFTLTVEAGATANVNGLMGTVNSDIIGTSEPTSGATTMVQLNEGLATFTDLTMVMGAVPTAFDVVLDGKADLKNTDIMGIHALGIESAITVGTGSELSVSATDGTTYGIITNNGTFTVSNGASLTNYGDIVNNGTATIDGTLTNATNSDTESGIPRIGSITNNSDMTIDTNGKVSGTVENTATVSVNSKNSNLTVNGGTVKSTVENMPNLGDGTTVDVEGKGNYTSYSITTNGYKIVLGIITGSYAEDRNYAGQRAVDVIVLTYTDLSAEEPTAVAGTTANINHITLDEIYATQEAAVAGLGGDTYGTAIDVGDYYARLALSVSIPNVTSFSELIIAPFKVMPAMAESVVIRGNGINGAIADQIYTGSAIEPQPGVDFNVYVNGSTTPLDPSEYSVSYSNNTAVNSMRSATITVTLNDTCNYTYDQPITAGFNIIQDLKSMTATSSKETYYAGEKFDITDLTVTGTLQNDQTTSMSLYPTSGEPVSGTYYYTIDAPEYIIDEDEDGKVTFTLTYTGNADITCQVTVNVTAVKSVEVADISSSDAYAKEYDVGDSLNTNGMQITVTYEDNVTAVFQNTTEAEGAADTGFTKTGGTINGDVTLSAGFVFEPTLFNTTLGPVDVTVTYFVGEGNFSVTVLGYIVTYMVGDDQYATQLGAYGDFASVYNYLGEVPTEYAGQSFSGWRVGETGAIYQPGDVFKFGEDTNMWTTDEITFNAQFGASTGGNTDPETPTEGPLAVSIYKDNGNEYVVIAVSPVQAGSVPAGDLVVTYSYMAMNPLGIYDTITVDIPVEDFTAGMTSIVLNADDFGGNLGMTISISASFTVGETTYTSNPMSYNINLTSA